MSSVNKIARAAKAMAVSKGKQKFNEAPTDRGRVCISSCRKGNAIRLLYTNSNARLNGSRTHKLYADIYWIALLALLYIRTEGKFTLC